jgi:hypothetical protein
LNFFQCFSIDLHPSTQLKEMGCCQSSKDELKIPEEVRLQRKPTHQKSFQSNGQLTIGYERFQFHGGAPPYRGYHFSSDGIFEIDAGASWETFCQTLKKNLDPDNGSDLTFSIYSRKEKETTIYSEHGKYGTDKRFPEMTLLECFIRNKSTLRVYRPFGRGMVDIGTFEPVDKVGNHSIISLKSREFFTSDEVKQLMAEMNCKESSNFQLFEKPPSLSKFKVLRDFADQIFEERKKSKHIESTMYSVHDLQIPLFRTKLIEFIGEEALKELDFLFGGASNDIVLRRCDYLNHCIDFHVDYAYKTMQVALNDDSEYEGGRLVFVSNGKLEIPKRKSGTITLHEKNIIHGVTALRSGIRYGLLILNRPLTI